MAGEINFSDLDTDEDEGISGATRERLEALAASKPSLSPARNAQAAAAAAPKERERQFNVGNLPVSVIDAIEDAAHDARTNRKTFVLRALKAAGVAIPERLIRDRRTAEDD